MFELLLYGGISLIIIGLILFVISQYKFRSIENKIDRQKTTSIIYTRENKIEQIISVRQGKGD